LAKQSSFAGKTVFFRLQNPRYLLTLLHLLWCRLRRLITLRRLIKMVNLSDFIDPTNKNSCTCIT
jgi:hypothetical protein